MRDAHPSTFAQTAVELKLFETDATQIAFAVMLASMVSSSKAFDLEVLAHRCGIESPLAESIVFDAHHGAALIGAAHRHFLQIAQLGLEDEVSQLIAARRAQLAKVKELTGAPND